MYRSLDTDYGMMYCTSTLKGTPMFTRQIHLSPADVAEWLATQPETEQTRMIAAALAEMERQRRIIQAVFDGNPDPSPAPPVAPLVRSTASDRPTPGRKPDDKSMAGTIREALKEFGPMTLDDIATLVSRNRVQTRSIMTHMIMKGKIVAMKGGIFALAK